MKNVEQSEKIYATLNEIREKLGVTKFKGKEYHSGDCFFSLSIVFFLQEFKNKAGCTRKAKRTKNGSAYTLFSPIFYTIMIILKERNPEA